MFFFFFAFASLCNNVDAVTYFNVIDYGAKPDGVTDSTYAFINAWNGACQTEGISQVSVPEGTYLTAAMNFYGPCKQTIIFENEGIILATENLAAFPTLNWIVFAYLDDFKLTGHGTFDAQGASTWGLNDRTGITFPTSIQLSFVNNSRVEGITSLNSKMFHMMIFQCTNIDLAYINIIAPENSPNTDGIHIGLSDNIKISTSHISTGDDCVSIGPTNNGVTVENVYCGPGHGISIGSLGKYETDFDVSNILVKNCTIVDTMNGVRIKTWQKSFALTCKNFTFEDIYMKDVSNPIIIDQEYCPFQFCAEQDNPSKVKIEDMKFKNIVGTSKTPVAINLKCSRLEPCKGVELSNIDLHYQGLGKSESTCINVASPIVQGNVYPTVCGSQLASMTT
ncbi:Polygalacturonase, family GH28 [Zostera marina]|uniref:Exopolygalacturonase n=1 Tax=Zostera marina TaxID=29655 RepID=A0A0K9PB15_ZOSMR|nr:Polygalacturonase, family GH28 [Zostera marina]